MPFLGTRQHPRPAACILGAPYDATATHRRGAATAPAAIRWASESIETFSPGQQRDLEDLAVADVGDLDLGGCSPEAAVERIRAAVAGTAGLPVLLGGEHTVALGAVFALSERHPDLAVVVADAHLDLRDTYDGQRWSHATVTRRIAERLGPERITVLAARSGTRDEWGLAVSLAACTRTAAMGSGARPLLSARPLYLSVDIDAFDPALAPGTGNPEPLGLSVEEFMGLLSALREYRVVGCDVVEVSPPFDPSGRTAVLAAWIVREMLLAFVR